MKVIELKRILEHVSDDSDVKIEYTPRPSEFISEYAEGARIENEEIVIFGNGFFDFFS